MSSSLRRGSLAASALVLAVATLTACGAGNQSATDQIKPDNASTTKDDIKLQGVNVVTVPDNPQKDDPKGPATVTGRIFNNGPEDEALKSVTVDASGVKAELTPAKGEDELTIPAGGSLKLGGKNEAEALIPDARDAKLRDGNAQGLTFDLSRTGKITLKATVVPATGHYSTVGPTVEPSASASESPSETGEPDTGQSEAGRHDENPAEGEDSEESSVATGPAEN